MLIAYINLKIVCLPLHSLNLKPLSPSPASDHQEFSAALWTMDVKRNHVFIAIFIILGTVASQATSRALYASSFAEKHEQWMEKFGRVYPDSAEKERRFSIFMQNVEYVEKFNNEGNKTYKLSINEFSDMTNEEFLRRRTGYKMATSSNSTSFRYQSLASTEVPTSVDWREKGAVTPIKDQGSCSKKSTTMSSSNYFCVTFVVHINSCLRIIHILYICRCLLGLYSGSSCRRAYQNQNWPTDLSVWATTRGLWWW